MRKPAGLIAIIALSLAGGTAHSAPPIHFGLGIDESNEAEQTLSEGNLPFTNPRTMLGWILPRYSNYANLAPEFKPAAQGQFELVTLLIPKEDLPTLTLDPYMSENMKNRIFLQRDGKTYVRFFILPMPAMLDYYADEIRKYARDTATWIGTPQSSGRTYAVRDSTEKLPSFLVKMSLDIKMGTGARILKPKHVAKAPRVSQMLAELQKKEGILPPGKRWFFFPEPAGTLAPDGKGGIVFREFPEIVSNGTAFAIPLFALVNPKRQPTWLDTLAEASGKNRQEFIWTEVVAPLVDLYSKLALENGIIPELHQQNSLLVIDRKTNRVLGIGMRDAESCIIDPVLRRARGLDDHAYRDLSYENLGAASAKPFYERSYDLFTRSEAISFLFGGSLLSGVSTSELLKRADLRLLENANKVYPDKVTTVSDLTRVTEFASQSGRTETPQIDRFRQIELRRQFSAQLEAGAGSFAPTPSQSLEKASFVQETKVITAFDSQGHLLGMADIPAESRNQPVATPAESPAAAATKVTVTIPLYNDIESIDRALESILNQTHRNLEIFLVDDHSTDEAFEHVRAKYNDPRLHLIRLNKNVGLYSVKNFVLKNFATGEFITNQDSDDFSHPERIRRQVARALERNVDSVSLVIRRMRWNGAEKDIYTEFPDEKNPEVTVPALERSRYTSQSIPSEDKAIYRTRLSGRLGGFNGRAKIEGDSDLAGRFARLFRTGAFTDFPLYYWVRRENSLTTASNTGSFYLGMGDLKIPSAKRTTAVIEKHWSRARANFFYATGRLSRFFDEIVEDFYYPPDLKIESYSGPGLPDGVNKNVNPKSEENLRYLNARLQEAVRLDPRSWTRQCVDLLMSFL